MTATRPWGAAFWQQRYGDQAADMWAAHNALLLTEPQRRAVAAAREQRGLVTASAPTMAVLQRQGLVSKGTQYATLTDSGTKLCDHLLRLVTVDEFQRLARANTLLEVIASHGRRFFRGDGGTDPDTIASFELDDAGRVWFVDHHSRKRIFTGCRNRRWRDFTGGGSLRRLVEAMADYIGKGLPVDRRHFDGELWDYDSESMKAVLDAAEMVTAL